MAEYTANMQHMQDASKLVSKMIGLVKTYERGTLIGPDGFEKDLSPTDVTELKGKFTAARTECKAHLDAVEG